MTVTRERVEEIRKQCQGMIHCPAHYRDLLAFIDELKEQRDSLDQACVQQIKVGDALAEQVKSLTAERDAQKRVNLTIMETNRNLMQERDRLAARVDRLEKAIRSHLRTVSSDWYINEFSKPQGGVSSMIHNDGIRQRAAGSFKNLSNALAREDDRNAIEEAQSQIDQWKDKYQNLCKFMNDYNSPKKVEHCCECKKLNEFVKASWRE